MAKQIFEPLLIIDEQYLGQRIKALRDATAGLLICTETASESLNLQFCTAMVNYDIPWNPMTIEQRIGRIDRIGQERPDVDIVNLFYEDTFLPGEKRFAQRTLRQPAYFRRPAGKGRRPAPGTSPRTRPILTL